MTPDAPGQYLPRLDHSFFDDELRPHLGAVLLKSRLLKPEQLDDALSQQAGSGQRLGEILIERGWLFPQDLARGLALQHGIDYVNIQHVSVDLRAAACLDHEIGTAALRGSGPLSWRRRPPGRGRGSDQRALAEVQAAIGPPVVFAVTELADIQQAWRMVLLSRQP